jgi:hypothetical protein
VRLCKASLLSINIGLDRNIPANAVALTRQSPSPRLMVTQLPAFQFEALLTTSGAAIYKFPVRKVFGKVSGNLKRNDVFTSLVFCSQNMEVCCIS